MRVAALFMFCVFFLSGCGAGQDVIGAAMAGNINRVKVIMDHDPEATYATDQNGNTPAILAILNGHKELAIYLVEKGYPMNGAPAHPFPLIMACCSRYDKSSDEMLEYLLKAGADPNIQYEPEGWTALGMAVNNGMPEKVRLLVKFGALMDQADGKGETPIQLARNRLALMKDPKVNFPHGELQNPAVRQQEIDTWTAIVALLESLQPKP